jgi:hypothetical protein
MKKSVYQTIISLLILVIVMSVFGVFKTSVDLKLETQNPNECISVISGRDLCQQMLVLKIIIIFCLIIVSGMLSFRSRLLKL